VAKAKKTGVSFSHIGPEAKVFRQARRVVDYGNCTGEKRTTGHSPRKAAGTTAGLAPAWIPVSSPWEPISPDNDVLFYEGACTWRGGRGLGRGRV